MDILKLAALYCILLVTLAYAQECSRSKDIPEGRKCRKACKRNRDCKGNKKCLCDDICGYSCFNPDADCDNPPGQIKNGEVHSNGTKYGSVAIYQCKQGYTLHGSSERKCRSDKKWSGEAPKCIEASSCNEPPEEIKHGSVEYDSLTFDSVAVYFCESGYTLDGKKERRCKSDGTWSKKPPTCVRTGCTYPPRLGEAFPSVASDKTQFANGDVVSYKCRFGFTLSGNPNSTCSDLSWSAPAFLCVKVSCGEPEKPHNGYFEAKDFLFGTWVTYKCNKGYFMENARISRRYCSSTGSWSGGPPKCNIKSCPPPISPTNGKATAYSHEYGSEVTYSCDTGYRLAGGKVGSCDDEESWGVVPTCEVDVNCDFEKYTRPICGYTNTGLNQWIREVVESDKSGFPSNALKYNGGDRPVALTSPIIPDSRPHCIQFYYKPKDTLRTTSDLSVHLNGARIAAVAPPGSYIPKNRWIGFQTTMRTQKETLQFGIVATGVKIIHIDDVKLLKGECDSSCAKSNPCQNRGICIDEIGTSYCSCVEPYRGISCTEKITCDKPTLINGIVTGPNYPVYGEKIHYECNPGFERRGSSFDACTRNGFTKELPTCIEQVNYVGECPTGFTPYQLMCYKIFDEHKTYDEANSTCARHGSQLATVQSKLVNDFIRKESPTWRLEFYLWIGLRSKNYERFWGSGFDFEGIGGVTVDSSNLKRNSCGSYHYKRGAFRTIWRIEYRSCERRSRFICERWKASASSYTIEHTYRMKGNYRPVNGLVTGYGRQMYQNSEETSTYLYRDYTQNAHSWVIGVYFIRHAFPGDRYAFSYSSADYPDKVGRWYNNRGREVSITITENNWWNKWSPWECHAKCGRGTQRRIRTCYEGVPGSMECKGKDKESKSCYRQDCSEFVRDRIKYNGVSYDFFLKEVSWYDAVENCRKHGMELAISNHTDLQTSLSNKISQINGRDHVHDNFWINGQHHQGQWWLANNNAFHRTRDLWNVNEPNSDGRFNDCLELSSKGGWNDHDCRTLRRFICERAVPTQPTVTACSLDPCNGQKCIVNSELPDGFECFCSVGRTGTYCETERNSGSSATSLPELTRTITQSLVQPFKTTTSAIPASGYPCSPDPCNGRGSCRESSDSPDEFDCFCEVGYNGKYCEIEHQCKVDEILTDAALYKGDKASKKLLSNESVLKGDKFILKCITTGTEVLGEQTIVCNDGGQWSRLTNIICVNETTLCTLNSEMAEKCDVLFDDDTKVGQFPVGVESGSFLLFKIKKDQNIPQIKVGCLDGKWQTDIPKECGTAPVSCPDVPELPHRSTIVSPPDSIKPYKPGTTLKFSCAKGHNHIGAKTTTCQENGLWSNKLPKCEEPGCSLFYFELKAGAYVKGHKDNDLQAKSGEEFVLTCNNDKSRELNITCMGREVWEPKPNDFSCS